MKTLNEMKSAISNTISVVAANPDVRKVCGVAGDVAIGGVSCAVAAGTLSGELIGKALDVYALDVSSYDESDDVPIEVHRHSAAINTAIGVAFTAAFIPVAIESTCGLIVDVYTGRNSKPVYGEGEERPVSRPVWERY